MLRLLFILCGTLATLSVPAQADTMLVYDLSTKNTSTLLPVPFNTAVTSGYSSSSVGTLGNKFPLPQGLPFTNLFSGSGFSKLVPAQQFFNLASYPMRTVTRLDMYLDTSHYVCTGMIVGPCFVLTSGVSIYNLGDSTFIDFDSIRVFPAFNNAAPQPGLPSARVKKIYAFQSLINKQHLPDNFALLELDRPIGIKTGWTGIGFDESPQFVTGKVFHKFSYPADYDPADSKTYNGDTLYYNYGSISDNGISLSIPSGGAFAVTGQNGSTFLYSNNVDFYSVGMLTFSTGYMHYKLSKGCFHQLLNVLQTSVCNNYDVGIEENSFPNALTLFPNPFRDEATLQFSYDPSERYSLQIIDPLGRQVTQENINSGTVKISSQGLSSGIYLLQLRAGNSVHSCKMAVE